MKNFLFFLLIFFLSCNSQLPKDKNIVINGHLSNAKNDTLYFSKLHYDKIDKTDTIVVDAEGNFHIEFLSDQCHFYILAQKENNFVRLLIDLGEKIEFSADIKNIPATYKIEGSKGSLLLKTVESKIAKSTLLVDSLTKVVSVKKNQPDFDKTFIVLDSIYKTNFNTLKTDLKQIINQNMTSLASVVAIFQSLAGQSIFNQFDDYELFCNLSDSIYAKYPNNSFAINLKNRVIDFKLKENEKKQIEKTLQIGLYAPDIKTIDKNGQLIQLSSLKGKVVLLKFWDSHCTTCNKQNFKLKEIYNKYKPQGFEIFAVSVDVKK